MRKVDYIVIHCTGASQQQTVESIQRHWAVHNKWKNPGYHRIIEADGTIHNLADFENVTNGVRGFNHNSIHICYIGGQHLDNRTEEQKGSILKCILEAMEWVENKPIIQGHRDFEGVAKACPQFNAKEEYSWITA